MESYAHEYIGAYNHVLQVDTQSYKRKTKPFYLIEQKGMGYHFSPTFVTRTVGARFPPFREIHQN
jgi:hypothetical protein